MATGIRDKVAIIGMGCTKFGERWESGGRDLLIEAYLEGIADAGIEKKDIQAVWYGTYYPEIHLGNTAGPCAVTFDFPHIPVTRTENACCTGTEAFRGACYAVAAGAYDMVMAIGMDKLKDAGYGGLPAGDKINETVFTQPDTHGPPIFAQLASGYRRVYGVSKEDVKKAIAHVSWKSHQNGCKNPKAHLRITPTMEQIISAPIVADPLGLYDACGVSDGAACAIITTPEIAKSMGHKDPILVKALQISASGAYESRFNEWDWARFVTCTKAAIKAYEEAGIKNPRDEISNFEVHDCFSITELVLMEDLQMSDRGQAYKDVLDGAFDMDGRNPCQTDGGLKCFGHPIGASGIRMIYENYLQLKGRAGDRQLKNLKMGLTHNVGGGPDQNITGITIIGRK
jgi:acetyl-CoA C-acetyltransferase